VAPCKHALVKGIDFVLEEQFEELSIRKSVGFLQTQFQAAN
jgi:hypothetical protein